MITALIFSVLSTIIGAKFYRKFVKKYVIIKKYHFHHTFHGVLFLFLSIPFIIKEMTFGTLMAGFGAGLMIHHLISEKHLRMIDKI